LRASRRDRYPREHFRLGPAKRKGFAYEETKRAAKALTEMDCDIMTGGGPGLMQGATEGATEAPPRSPSMLSTEPPLADPEDMTIPVCLADADEAIARIRAHHRASSKGRSGLEAPDVT
jgi:hypothetical protein